MTVQHVILQHILNAPPVTPAPALARRHHHRRQRPLGHVARTCRAPPDIAPERKPAAPSSKPLRKLGIHTLTLFALSSANWKRPPAEVNAILRLLHEYLLTETTRCMEDGVRISIIGRRDRIPVTLRQTIADAEAATARGTRLHLAPGHRLLRAREPSIWRLAATTKPPNFRRKLFRSAGGNFARRIAPMWTC